MIYFLVIIRTIKAWSKKCVFRAPRPPSTIFQRSYCLMAQRMQKLPSPQARNITITRERIGAAAGTHLPSSCRFPSLTYCRPLQSNAGMTGAGRSLTPQSRATGRNNCRLRLAGAVPFPSFPPDARQDQSHPQATRNDARTSQDSGRRPCRLADRAPYDALLAGGRGLGGGGGSTR